jgi:threonine dehydrogenase-like Zn-dependent dehydrogenase
MKAAVVESPGKLVIRDLPQPAMGPYEARCKMLFGSVCAGTDTHLLHFHPPFCYWMKPPYILGHESVGRIVEVGPKVRNYKPGDVITRVGCPAVGDVTSGWGGFAQEGIATDWRAMQEDGLEGWADKTVQQVLPPDIDPAVGTLFITWRETLSYTTRMGIGPGANVLVMGSGGNGLAFAAHARNRGAARVALVGAANRAGEAKWAGVTDYFDYKAEDCWKKVQESVPGGYDFVIDAVGKAAMTAQGQKCLRAGGTIGIYGMDEAGQIKLDAGRSFTFFAVSYDEGEAHEAVLSFYRAGKLNPAAWQDRKRVFTLADLGQALEAVRTRTLVKPLVKLND